MEKHKPLISIALAVFNGHPFLRQQLESLTAQTYPHIEIIISDDHSSDGTKDIIAEFQQQYSNIIFFENEGNRGIKSNFTNVLNHCNGDYIALCDQDDVWLPKKIQILVNEIGDNALIYHNSLFIDDQERSLQNTIADKFNCYSGNNPSTFLLYNCISGHACMFNKNLLRIALPFPEARFHDWWLAFVAAENGGVKYLPVILVHYRQHSTAATDLLKRNIIPPYQKEVAKYKAEVEWYTRCDNIAGSRRPLIKKWVSLYRKRENEWFSPSIFFLILKNKKTLFTVRKTNSISIFFAALKMIWGLKLKKIMR